MHTGLLTEWKSMMMSKLSCFPGQRVLFCTTSKRILCIAFHTEAEEMIRRDEISAAISIELKGRYLFVLGTQRAGIILLDKAGKILRKADKKSGIRKPKHTDCFRDRQGALWLGLGNGISRLEISSPFLFFGEKEGLIGRPYASITHDDKLYVSTNLGVFYRSDSLFRPVKGISSGWSGNFYRPVHSEGDTSLLVGTLRGVYLIRGDKAERLTNEADVRLFTNLLESRFVPGLIYVGGRFGVLILSYEKGQWKDLGFCPDSDEI